MKTLFFSILFLLIGLHFHAQQLAFPTAEGYGKYTKGGRGGAVYEVTNLNDSGVGSLRAAVEASEPRTVIFKVSGTISLESALRIKHPYITIAGQTAPGDGICVKKNPIVIEADHVIIRYIRVRLGNETNDDTDAVSSRYTKNIILDHISASWSVDETMSVYHCENITVQWCIISESMFDSNHVKGTHGFGGIWGSNYSSYHHNLIAHHSSRNMRMASGSGYTDYRNNVIYNWGYNSCYGGENQQVGNPKFAFSKFNIVANYYKPGPATQPGEVSYRIANPSKRKTDSDFGSWYIANNVIEGNNEVSKNNWNGGVQPQGGEKNLQFVKSEKPWEAMPINQQSAEEAFHLVLENAGAILPKRDIIDTRIINETVGGFATFEGGSYKAKHKIADTSKKTGIINTQNDVGGWPELKSLPAPIDTDHDGMPDVWEDDHQLDKTNPEDRNKLAPDGYTMLEKYLNGIK
ncbi:pectate lyase [Tamlana sp. s12]|uniref:pectate lyase family protein n=1 Tax=Tamlana sp. s12 TaxID=1630406 RepID=UPI00080228E5|nr:pectate lyase [Tamlana sp. s12]OBQ55850.1 pectate lyase [Tamlana sp. s12]QQY83656.1 pectate lyase [Tamlana sp. s12]